MAGSLHLAQAATPVGGFVAGTWTPFGSPYLVTNDVSAVNLTILPGVEVCFQGPYVFEVTGILRASGTENHHIVFTNAEVGWNGIFFNMCDPSSFLSFCDVFGSTNSGIRIKDTAPRLTDCLIASNSAPRCGGGILASNGALRLELSGCTIRDNRSNPTGSGGGYGGGVYVVGDASFVNCTISSNLCRGTYWFSVEGAYARGGGIYANSNHITLRNCTITGNTALSTDVGNDFNTQGGGIHLESGVLELVQSATDGNGAAF